MSNRFKWIQMGYLRISPIFRHAHTHIWNGVELFAESPRAKPLSDAKALHGSRSARGDSELSVSPACWYVRVSSWATLHIMLVQPETS